MEADGRVESPRQEGRGAGAVRDGERGWILGCSQRGLRTVGLWGWVVATSCEGGVQGPPVPSGQQTSDQGIQFLKNATCYTCTHTRLHHAQGTQRYTDTWPSAHT